MPSSVSKRKAIDSADSNNHKKLKMSVVEWGEWMTSWKAEAEIDQEAARIDRQKAAFGGDTVARLKDLNILIVGCRGVGVETAKNLILSNVGGVVLWDLGEARMRDRGSNFYLTDQHVSAGVTRAEACLPELRSLNPYCRVDVCRETTVTDDYLLQKNVLGTGLPFSAVVVSDLSILSKKDLFRMNETCRTNGIAFCVAANHGVTATIFSDFGPTHEIADATGEPTQTLAISNVEILPKSSLLKIDGVDDDKVVVIITVAQAEHGLDDGDSVSFDDLRGDLAPWNGKTVKVKRVALKSPSDANVDASGVEFKEALKYPTAQVVDNFERQYQFYKQKFEEENSDGKFQERTITMFNRLALVLEDSVEETFGSYESGGLLNQVKPPITKEYKSLQETLEGTAVPQMLRGEEWEAGAGIDVHLAIAAVLDFYDLKNRWPGIHNAHDASKVVEIAKSISSARKDKEGYCWSQSVSFGFPSGEERDLDEVRVGRFARLFQTELTGLCAFLGGAAAQEVLKATGKFTPINQWIHHDEHALVVDECPSNVSPVFGSRYDDQIAIMGKDFQARAANQRVFLVGCGALGCEYLKGLALMGVGTGRDGKIYVTDMDRIEVSNLSRQFLFRQHDVGQPKSISGARVVKGWNPQMNIEALERKVGDDTEDFFDGKFWESLDVCWNALDNVHARKYTDSCCLFYSKPLLESGTLGTKCNSEVVLPFRTSSYNDGKESDDNENQIAMCTLRSFPYLPKHCIEFAKQSYFSDYFEFGPDQYESFRKDMLGFFEQLDTSEPGEQARSLRMIQFYVNLQKEGTIDFAGCVRIAFNQMMDDFRTSILDLIHSADEMEKSDPEKKFWTGTKRKPRPVDWTDPIPELMEYLYCTSNMYASIWGVDVVRDRVKFQTIVDGLGLEQPAWTPKKVNLSDADDEMESGEENVDIDKLKADLYSVKIESLQPATPADFEKDDDGNFHIDFLTVSTNLRSWNYDIKESPRHTVKVTAGRIIPALATTTAMVCGLVDIEFCKLVMGLQSNGRDTFLNSNINLAAGSGNFTTFSPDPPVPISTGLKTPMPETFTSWDKIEIAAGTSELSVEQLVSHVERSFGVSVDRVFAFGDSRDKALYEAVDKQKMDWNITFDNDGKPQVSDGVYTRWPQARMAVQMLGRLPPTSGQRKIFETQLDNVKKSLDSTKASFKANYEGPVSVAYRNAYRPGDDEGDKQVYFDKVFKSRNYIALAVHCAIEGGEHAEEAEDIVLPCIKYVFSA